MSNLVEACRISELQEGAMIQVLVQGRDILLARVGDKYYAADNHCPHMGGKLSQGELEGTVVTCPLHGSQFDLSNGQVTRWLKGSGIVSAIGRILKSPRRLPIYSVKVEDERILIEI